MLAYVRAKVKWTQRLTSKNYVLEMETHKMLTTTTIAMDLMLSNFVRTQERSELNIMKQCRKWHLHMGILRHLKPWWKFLYPCEFLATSLILLATYLGWWVPPNCAGMWPHERVVCNLPSFIVNVATCTYPPCQQEAQPTQCCWELAAPS